MNYMNRKASWMLALLLPASAMALPERSDIATERAEALRAIQANNLSWTYALNTGNAGALMGLYTADAIVMPPSDSPLREQTAIRDFWSGTVGNGIIEHNIETVDVRIEGDTAYQAAVWSAIEVDDEGYETPLDGSLLVVYKRQADGSWKQQLQTWN